MTTESTAAERFSVGRFGPARETLALLFAPALAFLSSLVSFARFHGWPLLAPEFLYTAAGVVLAGLLLGGLLAACRIRLVRVFGLAFVAFLFLDMQFGYAYLLLVFTAQLMSLGIKSEILLFAALAVICWSAIMAMNALQENLGTIFATVFATILVSTALLPSKAKSFGPLPTAAMDRPASDLPPVVHLILDGHIGVEGVPENVDGGAETKQALKQFYQKWGFRLSGRAYSPYFLTYDSLGNLLNGDASNIRARHVNMSRTGGSTLLRNRYFRKYAALGYRIRVYQSEHISFCEQPRDAIEHCFSYPVSSPQVVNYLDATTAERTFLFAIRFVIQSNLYQAVQGYLPNPEAANEDVFSLPVPAIAEMIAEDIRAFPRGRLFFAHLLIPHAPYAWNAGCERYRKAGEWLSSRPYRSNRLLRSSPDYRGRAYRDYLQQVRCSLSLLERLFTALDDKGVLKDATIIVHGDHGSRITLSSPTPELIDLVSPEDYIASYSTLFAMRAPGLAPGYDPRMGALHNLFAQQVLDAPPPVDEPTVYLVGGHVLKPSSMPAF